MENNSALAGFILGLAASAGVLMLSIPGLLDAPEAWRVWVAWMAAGCAIACALGANKAISLR
jgi:hypothetical protein